MPWVATSPNWKQGWALPPYPIVNDTFMVCIRSFAAMALLLIYPCCLECFQDHEIPWSWQALSPCGPGILLGLRQDCSRYNEKATPCSSRTCTFVCWPLNSPTVTVRSLWAHPFACIILLFFLESCCVSSDEKCYCVVGLMHLPSGYVHKLICLQWDYLSVVTVGITGKVPKLSRKVIFRSLEELRRYYVGRCITYTCNKW